VGIEEFIRFTVPGSIATLPLAVGLWLLKRSVFGEGAGAFWAAVAAMALVAFGYTIHQIWMCVYRKKWYERRKSIGLIESLIEKESDRAKATNAVVVWDYFAHSRYCDKGLREQDKRWWYFVHSLMSASIACLLGFLIAAVLGVILLCRGDLMRSYGWLMLAITYGVLSWFFCSRGRQTKDDVVKFELQIIEQAKPEIRSIILQRAKRGRAKRGCLPPIIGRS